MPTTTLPAERPASKPAARPKPVPTDADLRRAVALVDAIADTRFHRDARAIAEAAELLVERLELFAEQHTEHSTVSELRALGIPCNEEHLRQLAADLLSDVVGATWAVSMLATMLDSQVYRRQGEEVHDAR